MLHEFGPNIWIADGSTVTAAAGFHYPTRMTVIRVKGGDLVLWSPVALTSEGRAQIKALGWVRSVVAPNALHDSFLAEWQQAFPEADFYSPPGLCEKRPDIVFAGELGRAGALAALAEELDIVLVPGNLITTEAVLFHRESRTAVFTDLLQQFPKGWFTGWRALVARLDLMTTAEPAVPRKFRLAFTDRAAARSAIGEILDWPVEKVVVAHGAPVTENGRAFLKRAFNWLMPS